MKGLIKLLIPLLVVFGLAFGGAYWFQQRAEEEMDGKVESIASASLQGLREQARLTAFAASFVAVVTSKQERLGLEAERTMIMPGLVRYELDLNRLKPKDMRWDGKTGMLTVTLPPLILSGPEVDISGIREYDGGGLLMALTDAGEVLDDANRKRGQEELMKQARGEVPMRLARDATRRAIERSFAMPLQAAGLKATVVAKFAEDGKEPEAAPAPQHEEEAAANASNATEEGTH